MALKMHPSIFVHPGEWLKTEIVEPNNASISGLAAAFGVSRQAVSALLNGRASLTAEMALRFEMLFGIDAETMLRMQANYDLARARESGVAVDSSRLAA
jgi:addiction module HigA family antidote